MHDNKEMIRLLTSKFSAFAGNDGRINISDIKAFLMDESNPDYFEITHIVEESNKKMVIYLDAFNFVGSRRILYDNFASLSVDLTSNKKVIITRNDSYVDED